MRRVAISLVLALEACAAPGRTIAQESQLEQTDPSVFWNRLTTELGLATRLAPPAMSRAYALVHVAIYDALAAAQARPGAFRSRAVAAGAASSVLQALFDREEARLSGETAGQLTGLRSPEPDLELGRRVARLVLDRYLGPGAEAAPGPPPGAVARWTGINPILANAGSWRTFFLDSPEEFPAEPPYPFGSPADLRDLEEVKAVSLQRSRRDVAIVHRWADLPPPTVWNDLLNERIVRLGLGQLDAARAHAYLNAVMYDAFVACWRTKYTHWVARPFQRAPEIVTVVPTPHFPSYTSGHATVSGAASTVLAALFPAEAQKFTAAAEEAAQSRLLAGIHFRHDNEEGLAVGRRIGEKAVALMRRTPRTGPLRRG